jgi:hypothetical protein
MSQKDTKRNTGSAETSARDKNQSSENSPTIDRATVVDAFKEFIRTGTRLLKTLQTRIRSFSVCHRERSFGLAPGI